MYSDFYCTWTFCCAVEFTIAIVVFVAFSNRKLLGRMLFIELANCEIILSRFGMDISYYRVRVSSGLIFFFLFFLSNSEFTFPLTSNDGIFSSLCAHKILNYTSYKRQLMTIALCLPVTDHVNVLIIERVQTIQCERWTRVRHKLVFYLFKSNSKFMRISHPLDFSSLSVLLMLYG